MDDLEKELQQGFLDEAAQLLSDGERCFLELEQQPGDHCVLTEIFRIAHNLKGSANAVGFRAVGEFAHHFESLLLKVKTGELECSKPMVSLFLRCNDHISASIEGLRQDSTSILDATALLAEIEAAMAGRLGNVTETANAPVENDDAPASTVIIAPPAPAAAAATRAPASADESVRVSTARLEKLLNFVGELVILQTVLREQTGVTQPLVRRTVQQLGKVTKEIQDISMSLRMLPIKPTFQKMQRIVRDTAQALGKTIDFHYAGEDTEVDKTLLEHLSDPLVHLIRNAVDHGIEDQGRRVAAGKSAGGRVELRAFHESGRLILEIQDDGGGINPEVLRRKAVEKGVVRADAVLNDKQAIDLIFHAGFSTKSETTDVSGRGVGMDVVKTNIERLQGTIDVSTEIGRGTLFRITLPQTLAIIDAMVVRVGEDRYVIPMYQVHESLRPAAADVQYNVGFGETLLLRGENLPLFRADAMIRTKVRRKPSEAIAIVVRTEKQPFAVLVDDILGQQQVVIKKLGAEIQNMPIFSGCAILGDGRPALILELNEVIRLAQRSPERSAIA